MACTFPHRCLGVVPLGPQLAADVDDAAGVDHVVGRVDDSALTQHLAVPNLVEELVVRRSRDHGAAEPSDRVVVEDAAEGARREDVALDAVDLVGVDDLDPELADGVLHALGVDIGCKNACPRFGEMLREPEPHAAETLYGDGPAGDVGVTRGLEQRGADPEEAAERSCRARVPSAPLLDREAGYVRGRSLNRAEIGDAHVHVLGSDVRSAEVVDESTHRLEELVGLLARVGDDDGLAAAESGMRRPRTCTSSRARAGARLRAQRHASNTATGACRRARGRGGWSAR